VVTIEFRQRGPMGRESHWLQQSVGTTTNNNSRYKCMSYIWLILYSAQALAFLWKVLDC